MVENTLALAYIEIFISAESMINIRKKEKIGDSSAKSIRSAIIA